MQFFLSVRHILFLHKISLLIVHFIALFLFYLVAVLPAQAVEKQKAYTEELDPAIALEAWHLLHQTEERYNIPPGLLHAISLVETGAGLGGQMVPWPYAIGVNRSKVYKGTKEEALLHLSYLKGLGFKRFNVESGLAKIKAVNLQKAEAWLKKQPKVLPTAKQAAPYAVRGLNFAKRFANKWQAVFFVNRLLVAGHSNVDIGLMQVNWYFHKKGFKDLAEAFDPHKNVQYAVGYLLKHRGERKDWWASVGRYHSGTKKHAERYIKGVWDMYQKVHRLEAPADAL